MRDKLRDKAYYDKFVEFTEQTTEKWLRQLDSYGDEGKAGCTDDLVSYAHEAIVMRYSRGDAIGTMRDSVQKAGEIL
jgi:hypothetical protein